MNPPAGTHLEAQCQDRPAITDLESWPITPSDQPGKPFQDWQETPETSLQDHEDQVL